MAKHPQWSDEYWLLLIQLYLKKPTGLKPLYSRAMVKLALELHVQPQFLYEQMFRLRQMDTPRIEKLWEKYAHSPKRLTRAIALMRQMKGFGQASDFYEGVEMNESWERDFRPIDADNNLMPIHFIIILDLYFRLTPTTMVAETPEISELSKRIGVPIKTIVAIMDVFQFCDPYLNRDDIMISPLLPTCQEIWDRYGTGKPERLAALAAQLKEYF